MTNKYQLIIAAGVYLILSSGCITTPKNAAVLDIPFHPQVATNQCGAVALTMAMDYYDTDYNTTNIVAETYIPILNGSSFSLLQESANKHGLQTQTANLTINNLKQTITSNKIPVIYLLPLNNTQIGHFAVVTGISQNNKKIRIHGSKKPDIWIRSNKLLKRSSQNSFPTIIISR